MATSRRAAPLRVATMVVLAAVLVAQRRAAPVEQLLERFKSTPVFWQQLEIAKELATRRDPRTLTALEPLLRADDRHVRANAAFVLARLGDPRGLATIEAILADRSDRPLGQGMPRAPSNPAQSRWWTSRQIEEDRYYAVHMLGELRDSSSVDVLVPLLGDAGVNYHAAWALGRIGDARAIAPLIAALEDRSALMRVSAIQALEVLDAKEALPRLRELLNDRELPAAGPRVPVADTAKSAILGLSKQDAR
jgi:HEAT repeat protein